MCAYVQGSRDASGAAAGDEPLVVPEDIGRAAAQLLLDEVARGGVTDGTHQGLLLLLAALGPEEMNQVGGSLLFCNVCMGVWHMLLASLSISLCCGVVLNVHLPSVKGVPG
jgi:RNA 3'-terminal phosphate cyclase